MMDMFGSDNPKQRHRNLLRLKYIAFCDWLEKIHEEMWLDVHMAYL